MSAEDHLQCFISGLQEDIRHELTLLCPYCVSQAFGLAQKIEAQLLASQQVDTISFPSFHAVVETKPHVVKSIEMLSPCFQTRLDELRCRLEREIPKIVAAAFASLTETLDSPSQSLDSALDSDSTLDSHSTSDSSVGSDSDAVAVEVSLHDIELHCSPLPPPLVSGTTSPPTVTTSPDLLHFQLSQHMLLGNPSPPLTSGYSIASNMLSTLPYDSPSDKPVVDDALSFILTGCTTVIRILSDGGISGCETKGSTESVTIQSLSDAHHVFDAMTISGNCYFSLANGSLQFKHWDPGVNKALGRGFAISGHVDFVFATGGHAAWCNNSCQGFQPLLKLVDPINSIEVLVDLKEASYSYPFGALLNKLSGAIENDKAQMRALMEHSSFASFASQVVSNLLASFDILNLVDVPGNRSYLPVVKFFIHASHPLALLTNRHGDTFRHLAVVGFKSPSLRRLCKHTKLMKQLISETILKIQDIFIVQNTARITVLHVSDIDNIQFELAKLLILVPSINLSICDVEGGTSNCLHAMVSNTLFTNVKTHVNGGSLGTLFRTLDAVIFLYTSLKNASNANYYQVSVESDSCSSELINSKATYYRHLAVEHECYFGFYVIVPEKLRWLFW